MEIHHPSHDHLLILKKEVSCENRCSICRKIVDGNHFYYCWECEYYIHKSCAVLPLEINHHFHQPHPLNLCSNSFDCDSCHKTFQDQLCFRCFNCDFYLDVKCALMPDIKPSIIRIKDGDTPFNCIACMEQSSSLIFGCIPCPVHDSCSDIPTLILHVLHPQHTLSLKVNDHLCKICNANHRAFKFCCDHCSFAVHAFCVFESTSKKEAKNLESLCFFGCKSHFQSQLCVDSKYITNQSYIQLPTEIKHQFHSHGPLELFLGNHFWCDSCHKHFYQKLSYDCKMCAFQMDVKCTLMSSIQYDEGCEYTQSFLPHHLNHQHPLQLIKEACEIGCIACGRIHLSPIYGCIQCEYFLHQSCIELPTQIKHPLHDRHELSLQTFAENRCTVCLRSYAGLSYKCMSGMTCYITIGIECAFVLKPPSVHYKYHDHLLYLVEMQGCYECAAKGTFCRISKSSILESKHTTSYCLRCIDCGYNIDLLCGPLPCTIKHNGHVHEMTLVDSMVEDDSGEYYCDICEEERDPRLCAYYCKECEFVCHFTVSSVVKVFKGELGEVSMRIVNEWTTEDKDGHKNHSRGFETDSTARKEVPFFSSSRDILRLLTPQDVYDIEKCFHFVKLCEAIRFNQRKPREGIPFSQFHDGNVIFDIVDRGPPLGDDSDLIRDISFYDDDVLKNLIHKMSFFNIKTNYLIQSHELGYDLAGFGGHLITQRYSELLLTLFKKYGDLSIHSSLSKNAKTIIFYLLCRVLTDILTTPICDITEDQLFEWNIYLVGVQRAGFKMVFRETLHRIMTVYVGVQAMKLEKTLHDRLQKEIAEAHERIAKLTMMLDEATKSRDGNGLLSKNSEVTAKYIREAKLLQWKTGKYFFPDKQAVSGEPGPWSLNLDPTSTRGFQPERVYRRH